MTCNIKFKERMILCFDKLANLYERNKRIDFANTPKNILIYDRDKNCSEVVEEWCKNHNCNLVKLNLKNHDVKSIQRSFYGGVRPDDEQAFPTFIEDIRKPNTVLFFEGLDDDVRLKQRSCFSSLIKDRRINNEEFNNIVFVVSSAYKNNESCCLDYIENGYYSFYVDSIYFDDDPSLAIHFRDLKFEQENNIIHIGSKHYYEEDLTKHRETLDHAVPYCFRIEDEEFIVSSWVELNRSVANYLIRTYRYSKEILLNQHLNWSDQKLFSEDPLSNFYQLDNGLYLNCNHTAIHSLWILKQLLDIFGIYKSNCELILDIFPISEKEEVRNYYINLRKAQFRSFVVNGLKEDISEANRTIAALEAYDKKFNELNPSFVSFFLVESKVYFATFKSKFLDYLKSLPTYPREKIDLFKKRLDLYTKFMGKYYK